MRARDDDRGVPALRRQEEHERHPQPDHHRQERGGCPRQPGQPGRQVDDPDQQARAGQPQVGDVQGRRPPEPAAWRVPRAAAQHPPEHHRQAERHRDQPGAQGRHAQRGRADPAGGRGRRLRLAALRGNSDEHALEIVARRRDARPAECLPAHAGGRRADRGARRGVDLGRCQAPAGRWHRGDRDMVPDGDDAELHARCDRRSRGIRLTRAPRAGHGEDESRHRQRHCYRVSAHRGVLSHAAKLITPRCACAPAP